ncbi:MAG: hypothetical protein KatS3mg011_1774 [Acidimicrobiia bacterium]|nr:MAG: hypothetical protein KatS3mg011_1774 [Acidimicrobiia bacterium]
MARTMIRVRISPEAPTRAPETISTLEPITNPAAEAAIPDSELRNEITTGMSAPPIGRVPVTPTIRPIPMRSAATAGWASTIVEAATTSNPPARTASTSRFPGKVTGAESTRPCSLPKAISDPLKVTAPTARDTAAATDTGIGPPGKRTTSANATSVEAPPPKPLNTATSWGIAVIGTWRASTVPTTEPTSNPVAIVQYETTPRSANVTTTASSMPPAAIRLPDLAVAGEARRFKPRMKATADSR